MLSFILYSLFISVTILKKLSLATDDNFTISSNREERIFFGRTADTGSAPYQVSLRQGSNSTKHFCGGSFISKCHVITAAHCGVACADGQCKVAYGSNQLNNQIILNVEKFIPHKNYTFKEDKNAGVVSMNNDIAIIKLKEGNYPEFGPMANLIKIGKSTVPWGSRVTVTGWGYVNQKKTIPENLQTTHLRVSWCPAKIKTWKSFTCTTALYSGTCPGDSGGPIVYRNNLVGVASFGDGCEIAFGNFGYSDVAAYTDWIDNKMKESHC